MAIYEPHDRVKVVLTTDSTNGASGDTSRKVSGIINAVNYVKSGTPYTGTPGLTITEKDTGLVLFAATITAGGTSQVWHPSPVAHKADGTENANGVGFVTVADSKLTIAVTSAGSGNIGTVHVHLR